MFGNMILLCDICLSQDEWNRIAKFGSIVKQKYN